MRCRLRPCLSKRLGSSLSSSRLLSSPRYLVGVRWSMSFLPTDHLHLLNRYHKRMAFDFSGEPGTEDNRWFSDEFLRWILVFPLSRSPWFTCKHWCHCHRVFLRTMIERRAEQPFRRTSELISYVDHRSSFFSGRKGRRDREREREKDFCFLFGVSFFFCFSRASIERDNNMQLFSHRTVINFIIKFSCFVSLNDVFDQWQRIEQSSALVLFKRATGDAFVFFTTDISQPVEMLMMQPNVKNNADHLASPNEVSDFLLWQITMKTNVYLLSHRSIKCWRADLLAVPIERDRSSTRSRFDYCEDSRNTNPSDSLAMGGETARSQTEQISC